MRLAIIAASRPSGRPMPAVGERDALLVRERLALPDLGFVIEALDPGVDLAEQLAAVLQERGAEIVDVLLYASCRAAIGEDDEPFLCLDPENPELGDAVGDLAAEIDEHVGVPCLLVIEARYQSDQGFDDGTRAERMVQAMAKAVARQAPKIELVVSARPAGAHDERIPSRLTAGLLETLDTWLGPLAAAEAFGHARQSTDLGPWPSASLYVPADMRFAFRPLAATLPQAAPAAESPPAAEAEPSPQPQPPAGEALVVPGAEPDASIVAAEAAGPPAGAEVATPEASAGESEPARRPDRFPDRRPAPPSDRVEVTSVALSARRGAQPKRDPSSLPKVIIGQPSSPPLPPTAAPDSRRRPQPPPPPKHRRSRRSALRLQGMTPEQVAEAAAAVGFVPFTDGEAPRTDAAPAAPPVDAPIPPVMYGPPPGVSYGYEPARPVEPVPPVEPAPPVEAVPPVEAALPVEPTPPFGSVPVAEAAPEIHAEVLSMDLLASEGVVEPEIEAADEPELEAAPTPAPEPEPAPAPAPAPAAPPEAEAHGAPEPAPAPAPAPAAPPEAEAYAAPEPALEPAPPEAVPPPATAPEPAPPAPEPAPALPAGPAPRALGDLSVADWLAEAEAAGARGEPDAALGYYKKALGKLGTQTTPERAEIYVRIAQLLRQQGKARVAVTNFDKALAIAPFDVRALSGSLELNAELGNWVAVEPVEARYLDLVGAEHRYAELCASGERWLRQGRNVDLARQRFEAARDGFPGQRLPLQRLLEIYGGLKATEQVVDTRKRLLELVADSDERAEGYFDLGEWCLFEVRRPHDAHYAFEKALEARPTRLEILEVLATSLAELQEWAELERVYRKMVTLLEQLAVEHPPVHVLAEIHHRLALLYRDHLEDSATALKAIGESLVHNPLNLSGQLLAAELADELGDSAAAIVHLGRAAAIEPKRNATYHELFALARRSGDEEAAFLTASVLALTESASDEQRILYHKHRPDPVPAHKQVLDPADWELLRDAAREPGLEAVMTAVAPAVLRLRVMQLEAEGKLPRLPDSGRQDPETSTISVVRSIGWASHFLGLPTPAIHVNEEAAGTLVAPFAKHQSVVAGRLALRGRSLGELAFLVGRHLALRLPEHELVVHLRSVDELTACFLAALELVLHGAAPGVGGQIGAAAKVLAGLLDKQQTEQERANLGEAVERFQQAGGRVRIPEWLASVERCATRTGLLLCGDLATAAALIRDESEPAFLGAADRIDDLCAFAVSEEHMALREALGCDVSAEANGAPVEPQPG
jgi:tetratricopeptide (TPR) repeat protein